MDRSAVDGGRSMPCAEPGCSESVRVHWTVLPSDLVLRERDPSPPARTVPSPQISELGCKAAASRDHDGREATALRLDEIPIETFDALTRFAVFWMRLYGRTVVPKGEARFLAQVDNLRLEEVRGGLLAESTGGFRLLLDPPTSIRPDSAEFDVARALAGSFAAGGTDAAANVLSKWDRSVDDEHLWAVIGDLVAQLPPSDGTAKALTALQRNA